jgi:hypothetical protein
MIWILWALMLLAHGAFARWAQGAPSYASASVFADFLLIAIVLITLDQLQGLSVMDTLRTGLFFVAFGTAGRQLMSAVLNRSTFT